MLNHIILMGRMVRDPELRKAGDTSVCSFRIASDRDFKNKDGEKETDFVDVVVWRHEAEYVSKYYTKGRMVVVDGRLQIRAWKDRDGEKRYATEIVAAKVFPADSRPQSGDASTVGTSTTTDIPDDFVPDLDDEDLPF